MDFRIHSYRLGVFASFGGKTTSNEKINNIPIVFIHGNSDQALNDGTGNKLKTGWTESIQFFMVRQKLCRLSFALRIIFLGIFLFASTKLAQNHITERNSQSQTFSDFYALDTDVDGGWKESVEGCRVSHVAAEDAVQEGMCKDRRESSDHLSFDDVGFFSLD